MVRVHLSPLLKINEMQLYRKDTWGYSSVGRAPALQAGGHEFESRYLHSDSLESVSFPFYVFSYMEEQKTFVP